MSSISDFQHSLANVLGLKFIECMRLVMNVCKKEQYVVHYRNLKLDQTLAMLIIKIYRVVKFRQAACMALYIQLNSDLRARATPKCFEEEIFKLMNNSVFGKMTENLHKRIRFDLVRGCKIDRMGRLVVDPAYLSH